MVTTEMLLALISATVADLRAWNKEAREKAAVAVRDGDDGWAMFQNGRAVAYDSAAHRVAQVERLAEELAGYTRAAAQTETEEAGDGDD